MSSVLYEKKGRLGLATLNRQSSLNTLNTEMVCSMKTQFAEWFKDPSVSLIVLQGAGEKAFCAGGDVKSVVLEARQDRRSSYPHSFFANEYQLDYAIHHSPKPVVVIGHGITMGGGIGLLAGASCRVVTETSVLAMPEISIGFFPDVGGSYFLNKMPGKLGLFLALTASRMNAADSIFAGLADVFLTQARVISLVDHLAAISDKSLLEDRKSLLREIKRFAEQDSASCPAGSLSKKLEQINQACSGSTIQDVWSALTSAEGTFPEVKTLKRGSPTSAALIFEQLKRGKNLSLGDCFKMELHMALQCCQENDFIEGVRALLIDKDQKPSWKPERIEEVKLDSIERYFELAPLTLD
jgi:enoyl-CoA hydratase/carnithine racemase